MAVLADTDSRWKWAVQLSRRLHPAAVLSGYQLDSVAQPSARQLAAAGIAPEVIRTVTPAGLVAALAEDTPEVLVIALPGGGCQAMLHLLAAAELPNRPLVVTGYVGVVYEKVVEGLLLRAGADLIAANSPSDFDRFQSVLTGAGSTPAASRSPGCRSSASPRAAPTRSVASPSPSPASRGCRPPAPTGATSSSASPSTPGSIPSATCS